MALKELQELLKEIQRLNSLKENREHCTIDTQLEAMRKVVEAVDCITVCDGMNDKRYDVWEMIKKELEK